MLDMKDMADSSLYNYVVSKAQEEHRTLQQQVRHLLGMGQYHNAVCNEKVRE